jgi:hypothetical protein
LPCENDSASPRAWIDYVEAGDWKTRQSPRARYTYTALIASIVVGLIIYVVTLHWFGLLK